MTLGATLTDVSRRCLELGEDRIEVEGRSVVVERTRSKGLKLVAFVVGGTPIEGIEQNPETSSRWAKMAQEGRRIMQFRVNGRYVGNVCDGKLTRYPAWKSLGLPD